MGADPPRAPDLIDEKGSREIGNPAEAHAGVVEQAEVAVGHLGLVPGIDSYAGCVRTGPR